MKCNVMGCHMMWQWNVTSCDVTWCDNEMWRHVTTMMMPDVDEGEENDDRAPVEARQRVHAERGLQVEAVENMGNYCTPLRAVMYITVRQKRQKNAKKRQKSLGTQNYLCTCEIYIAFHQWKLAWQLTFPGVCLDIFDYFSRHSTNFSTFSTYFSRNSSRVEKYVENISTKWIAWLKFITARLYKYHKYINSYNPFHPTGPSIFGRLL